MSVQYGVAQVKVVSKTENRTLPWLVSLLIIFLAAGCASNSKTEELTGETRNHVRATCAEKHIATDSGAYDRYSHSVCPKKSFVNDIGIEALIKRRQWTSPQPTDSTLQDYDKPIPSVPIKLKKFGSGEGEGLRSLAAKLWLIDQAKYTIDLIYYIFKRDIVSYSILSKLCAAIKRGVDVRVIVDSLGSIHPTHSELKALYRCAKDAGYMYASDGKSISRQRASVQVVIFNALIHPEARVRSIFRIIKSPFSKKRVDLMTKWLNRRAHDKILLVDAQFPQRATVLIGGRNISIDYYDVDKNGQSTFNGYKDLEVVIKSGDWSLGGRYQVGNIIASYFDKLFNHNGNKKLVLNPFSETFGVYRRKIKKMARNETKLLRNEKLVVEIENMSGYLTKGFFEADAQLVHELGNLTDKSAVTNALQNEAANPNSIMGNMRKLVRKSNKRIKVISPYVFLAKYKQVTDDGTTIIYDETKILMEWLEKPTSDGKKRTLEIITNSVLTSDNVLAQAIIDMEMAPELLLDQKDSSTWRSYPKKVLLKDRICKDLWMRVADDENLTIWQTGRLDAVEFGGTKNYGKLHVKLAILDDVAVIGTTNGDHRSRLLNNEMAFIITNSPEFIEQLIKEEYDTLKDRSYKWGSMEWLALREKVKAGGGITGKATGFQEMIYWFIKKFELAWLI